MTALLLIVLIGVILYFTYWKKDTTDTAWEQPKQVIRAYFIEGKKRANKITTLIYRKYKL